MLPQMGGCFFTEAALPQKSDGDDRQQLNHKFSE